MEESEININDINEKLERLSERCGILEKKNNEYEARIKRNEVVIVNLNLQLINLRKEYNEKVNELKKGFEKLGKLLKDNNIFENEIIINFEKKNDENNEKKNNENDEKIIDNKEGSLLDKFENQLYNIFINNKNKEVSFIDKYELKKLSAALLIKYKNIKSPLELSKIFLEKNMNLKDTDESSKINIKMKSTNIYSEIDDVQLRKIDKNDKEKFLKEFREKYGILYREIPEKELQKEIEYRNYDENEIIKIILKRLGYI